jgi:threonine/homoserine efflux transporter RhtA
MSMATRRRLQFIQAQLAWMLAVVVVLALLGSLELELFFVLSLIGFLVVIELTAPIAVTPAWRRRLPWFIAIGLVVFGIIVIRRILDILPPGVFG